MRRQQAAGSRHRQQPQAELLPALESGFPTADAGGRVRASPEGFCRRPAHSGSPRAAIGCAAGARRVKGRARAGYKAAKVTARAGARGPLGVPFAARAPSPPIRPGSHGGSERAAGQLPHRRPGWGPGGHGVRCRRRGALPDCAEVSARPAARGPGRRPAPARPRRSPRGRPGLLASAGRFLRLCPHPLKASSGSSLRPWLGEGAAACSSLRGRCSELGLCRPSVRRMRAGACWSVCDSSDVPLVSFPPRSLGAEYLEEARVSSLRQEPALHTFKGLVHSEVEAVLLGHISGMGIGVNTLACHGSESTQTPVHKACRGQTPECSRFFIRVKE